jgi:threonine dehydratase
MALQTPAASTLPATESAQITLADVLAAQRTIRPWLPPTPLFRYPALDSAVGAHLFIKHENHQPIGAFKVRGGVNFLAHLPAEQRARGVVTASTGNHGQSIAWAAQLFGVAATIVVPHGANPVKVDAMRSLGAEVVFGGEDFEGSKRHARDLEATRGLRFVSSGDEPLLIAGVATHTLEIFEAQPDVQVIIVPVGGGSGAAGAALVAKAINPAVRVIGVQAAGAPAAFKTWRTHTPQTAPIHTFAAGLATGEPYMMPQQILWRDLDEFVLVDDDAMRRAMRLLLEKAKTLAEPAGAASLAAALAYPDKVRGQRVALILSGGNVSLDELRAIL